MIDKLKGYLGTGLEMESSSKGRSAYNSAIKRRLKTKEILTPELMETLIFLRRKPRLRSLSKLTEHIKVKGYNGGKEFIAYEKIIELNLGDLTLYAGWDLGLIAPDNIAGYTLDQLNQLFNLLHQWHFNLYFEKGEFIEI